MSEVRAVSERATSFVERLHNLSRGDLSVLKRNAGNSLAESRNAIGVFYRTIAGLAVPRWAEATYFVVSTLYALHPDSTVQDDFGKTMRRIRDNGSNSIDARMERLLECGEITEDNPELGFKLRQAVSLAKSKQIAINWPALVDDLCSWGSDSRWVQRKWARQYFGQAATDTNLPNEEQNQKQAEEKSC